MDTNRTEAKLRQKRRTEKTNQVFVSEKLLQGSHPIQSYLHFNQTKL